MPLHRLLTVVWTKHPGITEIGDRCKQHLRSLQNGGSDGIMINWFFEATYDYLGRG